MYEILQSGPQIQQVFSGIFYHKEKELTVRVIDNIVT